MKTNEYQCAMCKNVYQFAWSKEEEKKEAIENFGEEMVEHDEMLIVCDDCYNTVKPSEHPEELARAKNEFYSKRN